MRVQISILCLVYLKSDSMLVCRLFAINNQLIQINWLSYNKFVQLNKMYKSQWIQSTQILINLLILFLFSRYLNYMVFNKVLFACQQKMLCLQSLKQRTSTKAILEIVVLDNHSLRYCYWSSAIRCYLIFILAELPRGQRPARAEHHS